MSLPCVFLMGPTATGKTDLAIKLAKYFPLEIISVDSSLVYKGMDIGTGKPTKAQQAIVAHKLIDICTPQESYNAANFRKDALEAISDCKNRGKIPLLVGGTMMYFKVLLEGLSPLPKANPDIRAQLENEAKVYGWDTLYNKLKAVDPQICERIKPLDTQRIQRALEVYYISGKPISQFYQEKSEENPFLHKYLSIALVPNFGQRNLLHERIEARFDNMLQQGFIKEVQELKQNYDLNLSMPSMRCVGYRQVWQHLSKEYDFSTMRKKAFAATRQLAKRQLTWLRSWLGLNRMDFLSQDLLSQVRSLIE